MQRGSTPLGFLVTVFDSVGHVVRSRLHTDSLADYFVSLAGSLHHYPGRGYLALSDRTTRIGRYPKLWRLNEQLDTLWTRTYSHSTPLIGRVLCRLPGGDLLIAGSCQRPAGSSGYYDWFALRTDSLGVERWRRTYSLLDHGEAFSVLPTPDGGALLTGYARMQPPGSPPGGFYRNEMAAVKIDAAGTAQWQRTYGDSTDVGAPALPAPGGGYVVGGVRLLRRYRFQHFLEQAALYWLDSLGNLVRWRSYGPAEGLYRTYSLLAQPGGGYVLAGVTEDSSQYATTNFLAPIGFAAKVCTDGDLVWYREYRHLTGPRSSNYLSELRPTPDGGFVGAGFLFAAPPDGGTDDAWLFRTDSAGYVLAGGAPPTVRCRPVGVPEAGGAEEGAGVAVWPNPALDGWVRVRLPRPGARYALTDALGREVAAGRLREAEEELNLRHLPPGLYLLRLTPEADHRTYTYKLIR